MKNIDIKEMNAEQRENYMLMSVKTWQAMVMEDIISEQTILVVIQFGIKQLKQRIRLLNNIRVMHGKTPFTAYMLSHNLT